jgi:septum formation protein
VESIAAAAPVVLASGSPRRQELLHLLEIPFSVDPSGIDETPLSGQTPPEIARTLAQRKALDVARRHAGAVVIGADTLVDLQGLVLNKPEDRDDAIRMLRLLAGTTHQVHSGLAVWRGGVVQTRVVSASVRMHPASEVEIAAYVDTGEPMDKAGAYAAQGLGAALIEAVEGSYLAVVGLPLLALREMLIEAGIAVPADEARLAAREYGVAPDS